MIDKDAATRDTLRDMVDDMIEVALLATITDPADFTQRELEHRLSEILTVASRWLYV